MSHTIVLDVDYFECEVMESHSEAVHTEHAMSYIVSGELVMEHGDKIIAGAGDVVVVPAGVPHRLVGGADLKIWWLGFCVSCLDINEEQPLMMPFQRVRLGAQPVISIPDNRRERLVTFINELKDELQAEGIESFEIMKSMLLLILKEIYRALPSDNQISGTIRESLTYQALSYIQLHCLEPISLKDVASALHKTPAHLTATVKKSTGYSVGQWLTKARLSEACKRLLHSPSSVEDIAVKIGWNDVTFFIRQFKKEFGVTPAAWRKKNANIHH
ncbi:AraC family transcriptional regulator [Aliikangiella coralliicola]|uniref:Helix-turn-helix domain-containing protein n=1 Tax=Aliikangiella coralliicola TaxID=2592383 RepID=A0A545UE49_9GAMM|nr:AraC family transcriptional regulator [Aliikangiella coralliicola]TQV87728.1 helix-turn-helix domain-containing protein [Aliikangiella coralliicola]